jgi:tetratricopeptide (TPR) repeat protein
VLASVPEDATAQGNLGLVLTQLGDLDEGYKWLEMATKTAPESARAWTNLGICAFRQKRMQEALAAGHKATALDPKFIQAWLLLSDVLVTNKATLADAEKAALQAKSINRGYPGADIALSHVYLAMGDPDRAVAQLTSVSPRVAAMPYVQINLAAALEKAGRPQDALDVYKQVTENAPRSPMAGYARQRIPVLSGGAGAK